MHLNACISQSWWWGGLREKYLTLRAHLQIKIFFLSEEIKPTFFSLMQKQNLKIYLNPRLMIKRIISMFHPNTRDHKKRKQKRKIP
jgi:hypothetical protein